MLFVHLESDGSSSRERMIRPREEREQSWRRSDNLDIS